MFFKQCSVLQNFRSKTHLKQQLPFATTLFFFILGYYHRIQFGLCRTLWDIIQTIMIYHCDMLLIKTHSFAFNTMKCQAICKTTPPSPARSRSKGKYCSKPIHFCLQDAHSIRSALGCPIRSRDGETAILFGRGTQGTSRTIISIAKGPSWPSSD